MSQPSKEAKLNKFQKKVIANNSELRELNVLGLLIQKEDQDDDHYYYEPDIKYNVFFKYEGLVFCSEVFWSDYNNDYTPPSIDNFISLIKKNVLREIEEIDKVLYINTMFDQLSMQYHKDNVFDLIDGQLKTFFTSHGFAKSYSKYSSYHYNLDVEVGQLIRKGLSRPNIYTSILEDLWLDYDHVVEEIKLALEEEH